MRRPFLLPALIALLAVLAPAALSWVAYRGVRVAVERGFERRMLNIATTAATQVAAEDVGEAASLGEAGTAYAEIMLQLEQLRASTGLANASLFDSTRGTVYDCADPGDHHQPASVDSVAPQAVAAALAGRPVVSPLYRAGGTERRAGLAPILTADGLVAGALAVEADADYLPALADFRRTLLVTLGVITAAVALLAGLALRAALAGERLERRLARSETLAAMGRLTATLAHEIKNPLAIIRGAAQRLAKLEPEAQRMADFIVEESDRLSRTVARYLYFAKGGGSPGEEGDAFAALEETLALLEGEARSRQVAFESGGEAGPGRVRLDSESLKQIYLNVLLNAMDAMPGGGTVRIARAVAGGRVEVRIADQGPGLGVPELERAGTPFHTTKAQGSGLGLFLSRRLAQSAGGDLTIENGAPAGAIVTLRLPQGKGTQA